MNRMLIALAASLLLTGCDRRADDPVVRIDSDHPRMVEATAEARRRWPEFVKAFNEQKPGRACAVKTAFTVKGGGTEHMWLQVQRIEGDSITGRLDNDPAQDVGHQLGDVITIKQDQVEDWLLADGPNNMTGAFTAKAIEEIERERPKR